MIDPGLGFEMLLDESALGLAFDPKRVDCPSLSEFHGLSERTIQALRPVLRRPNAATSLKVLYRMYRNMGTANPGARRLALDYHMRYDISVFGCGTIAGEYFKTSGHYHPGTPGDPGLAYPEVYEVLHGRAVFLLQKVRNASDIYAPPGKTVLDDVILTIVEEGEHVVMPPNYGHVMLNLTRRPVVTSNWVSNLFNSYYDAYERAQGGSHYVLRPRRPDDGVRIEANPRMAQPLPEPRWLRPRQDIPDLGLRDGVPLYSAFLAEPQRFDYVSNPAQQPLLRDLDALFEPSAPPDV